MARTAKELHGEAVELVNRGRLTAAIDALEKAAQRTDDPDLRARIDGTLALATAHAGQVAAGAALCAEVLGRPDLSAETRTILFGQMGSVMTLAGRLDDADTWLTRAIDDLNPSFAQANLLMNRGQLHMHRRRLDDARRDTARAAEQFAAEGKTVDEAESRHNLGYIALLRGDIVGALREMGRARGGFTDVSPVVTAISDVDRAEVLRDAGQTAEAERILAVSAEVFGEQRMPQARAEAEVNLARSQLSHDPAAAVRTAAAAARRFRALGNDTWAARADAVRVRAALASAVPDARGHFAKGARKAPSGMEIDAVASALHRAGLRTDAVALRLAGELHALRRGAPPAGAVRVPANAPIDVRLLAREVRVARAAARGREGDIRRHAASGIEELARWQASFGSLDLQASIAMHGVPLLMAGLSSALRSGRPDIVFEWSERARHASQQIVPLRPPPDEETAAALAELRMLRSEDPGGDWLASPRAAELHEHVRERQWTTTGAAAVEERAVLGELQASLGDDTALLAYVWTDGMLACIVARRDAARVVPLPDWPGVGSALAGLRADLDVSAAVRSGPMAAVVQRALGERLATLSGSLLDEPLRHAGDARRIVLTTPGVLAGIPWAMLPGMRERVFTLASSATRWVRRGLSIPTPPPAAADAAPGASGRVGRDPGSGSAVGVAVGPRVARGGEEAGAVAAAWVAAGRAATVLASGDATADAVAELAGEVSVLHIAAHGRHAADNPLFSGLELADGTLFGYDIDRIPRVPDTVVLSACEVGRSSVRWGEQAIGMTRTWLHAGTRCVIAAPVVVADDVACELLGAVHDGLAAGEAPAEALAAASLRTGHVAPFECHGAGF